MSNRYSCTTSTFILNIKHNFNQCFIFNIYLLKFKFLYVINYIFLSEVVIKLYIRIKFAKLTPYHILIISYFSLIKDKLSQICSLYVKLHNLLNTTRCGKLLYLETNTHLLVRESYLNDVKMSYT